MTLGCPALVAARFDSGATHYQYCRQCAVWSDSGGALYNFCRLVVKVSFGRRSPVCGIQGHFGHSMLLLAASHLAFRWNDGR